MGGGGWVWLYTLYSPPQQGGGVGGGGGVQENPKFWIISLLGLHNKQYFKQEISLIFQKDPFCDAKTLET